MKKRMRGSLTVETSIIMSVLLFSIAVLIKESYKLSVYTRDQILLHEQVEDTRHNNRDMITKEWIEKMRLDLFRKPETWQDEVFQREIHIKAFEPEEYMRRITQEKIDGGNIQKRTDS